MPGRRAKILSSFDVGDLLIFASCTRHSLRNAVMVLLSAKAGLRAAEHPDLITALAIWREIAPPSVYVIASERGGRMRPLSIVIWFNRAFKNIGLKGCCRIQAAG